MAFARVDSGFNDPATGGGNPLASTLAASLVGTAPSGSTIVGVCTWDQGGSSVISGVADDKGNTYNLETVIVDSTHTQRVCCFSRSNITNGPKTVTATFGGSVGSRNIAIECWTGTATTATDVRSGTHGGQLQTAATTATDAVTSGNFTPADNGCLLWGMTVNINQSAGTTVNAGTNYTSGFTATGVVGTTPQMYTESQTQATAAATAATFTTSTAGYYITSLIAFKPDLTAAPAAAPGMLSMMGVG